MSANIIDLDNYRNHGNGAREVLIDHMSHFAQSEQDLAEIGDFIDTLLARLWMCGYKIVPIEDDDASDPKILA